MTATLIVFSRYPRPGEAKTRLAPTLGPEGAAELARRMLVDTWEVAKAAARSVPCRLELHGCGAGGDEFSALLGHELPYFPQSGSDMGQRLERAFSSAFARAADRVVLVGTDCPPLSTRHIEEALAALDARDVAIGPAHDGGWWLLGLRASAPVLFRDISWSTPAVLGQTLAAAQDAGLCVAMLETLADIDTPEDLEHGQQWT